MLQNKPPFCDEVLVTTHSPIDDELLFTLFSHFFVAVMLSFRFLIDRKNTLFIRIIHSLLRIVAFDLVLNIYFPYIFLLDFPPF